MIKKLYLIVVVGLLTISLSAQQPYYEDVNLNLSGLDLKNELATKIISTHTKTLDYSQAREALKIIDLQPGQATNVLLLYGYVNETCQTSTSNSDRHRLRNKSRFGGGNCLWNREHTYPKSLGKPNLGNSGPGADVHHLRATDTRRNSSRGNRKFVSDSGNSKRVGSGWFPGDEWKGDVARMMMYMYLRYGNRCLPKNVAIGKTNSVDSNMIDLLLKWNAEDPVSEYEKKRNDYLGNDNNRYGQGNRNPFIDNPYLATRIWGGPKAEDRWKKDSTNDSKAPTAPLNISYKATESSITFSWQASSSASGTVSYELSIDGGTTFFATDRTYYTFSNLTASTEYTLQIKAIDTHKNTSKVVVFKAKTLKKSGNIIGGNVCGNETFSTVGSSLSSFYSDRSWIGNNNVKWYAKAARTDQKLNGKAITLGKKNNAQLYSNNISGGISSLSVTTKRVFSGGSGTFDLIINGKKVGVIEYSGKEKKTTISNINISGNISIKIANNSKPSNRVVFDDLSWKCYATAGIRKDKILSVKVYPNPSLGTFNVFIPQEIQVQYIVLYSILGKKVLEFKKPNLINNIFLIEKLESGIYLLKLSSNSGTVTKKIVVE